MERINAVYGKGFERYYESAKDKFGVRYVNSIPSMVKELQKSHNLLLTELYADLHLLIHKNQVCSPARTSLLRIYIVPMDRISVGGAA